MTSVSRSGVLVSRKAHWKEPRAGSSLCVTDFVPRRCRRAGEPAENLYPLDIEFEVRRAAAARRHQAQVLGPIERFVYSLISAAALTVVLMGVLSLAESQTGSEGPGQVRNAFSHSDDQNFGGKSDADQTRPN
jgi:hypothetical protein